MADDFIANEEFPEEVVTQWKQFVARNGRTPVHHMLTQSTQRLEVERKIAVGLRQAGVTLDTIENLNFDWHKEKPYQVNVSLKGAESQLDLAKEYFKSGLIAQSGKHNSFQASLNKSNTNKGCVTTEIKADNFTDLASGTGISLKALAQSGLAR